MTPKEFFRPQVPIAAYKGEVGKETDWMNLCELDLIGAQFLVVDANFVPSAKDGILISSKPGKYQVQIKGIDFSGDRRVSRLKVFLQNESPTLGKQAGETWTDTAQTGIVDYESFSKAWGDDDDASYKKLQDKLESAENFGVVKFDKSANAVMPFVSSGFGDGSFPVLELVTNGQVVGVEVEFISAEMEYPFEPRPNVDAPEKEENALAWRLQQAALRGDHTAANSLGLMYAQGDQVPQNFSRARGWYRYATKIGSTNAAYRLGSLYFSGKGGAKEYAKAKRFFEIAAHAGHTDALNDLGCLFLNGQGIPQDRLKANEYFKLAAGKGSAKAQFNLGVAYEYGRGCEKNLELAAKWYEASAIQGFAGALCNFGHCYLQGRGVPQDFAKAFDYFSQAADRGHVIGTINLGYCYSEGKGVPQDSQQAVKLYQKVQDKHPMAINNLAEHYERGTGITKNLKMAVKLFAQAADAGLPLAQYNSGRLYENGIGVKKDLVKATEFYQLAAKQGNDDAVKAMARLAIVQ